MFKYFYETEEVETFFLYYYPFLLTGCISVSVLSSPKSHQSKNNQEKLKEQYNVEDSRLLYPPFTSYKSYTLNKNPLMAMKISSFLCMLQNTVEISRTATCLQI